MERIKVIHVITRFDKGGSAENTFLTVKGLDNKRYDVLLIRGLSPDSTMGDEERKAVERNLEDVRNAGVRLITLRSLVRNIRPFHDLAALGTLAYIFRKERPHIVHTHTSKAGILGRWAAWLAWVPVIIHTPHGHVFWGYSNRWVSRFYALLERCTALITNTIITLTEQEKQDHLRFGITPRGAFAVIHSGVELRPFLQEDDPHRVKQELGIPPGVPVVGTVGRLTPIKGHVYFLEAARQIIKAVPDCHFLILGEGESLPDLLRLTETLGIGQNVTFLGWRADVARVISVFDIFVLPSLNEGMGRVIVEAMSAGKPVVASRVGGILDLVTDHENGLLVTSADAPSLSRSILHLLGHPAERIRMGCEGRLKARVYDADSMVQKIDHLYRDVDERKHEIPWGS